MLASFLGPITVSRVCGQRRPCPQLDMAAGQSNRSLDTSSVCIEVAGPGTEV